MGVPMRGPDLAIDSSADSFDFSEVMARRDSAPALLPRRPEAPQDNRALFIDAMSDPLRRGMAFNVVERNCRERLRQGEDGIKLYIQLLGYVRFANVREAVDEFERRFVPMLDQNLFKERMRKAR